MFVDVSMVLGPALGVAYFTIWMAFTYAAFYFEDRCYFKRARHIRIWRLVAMAVITIIGVAASLTTYTWIHPAVIMMAMCFSVMAACFLIVSGFSGLIYPLIRGNPDRIDWDWVSIVTWVVATALILTHLTASCASIFHWDGFFEAVVPHDVLVEYHLAYSEYLDEHAEWEEGDLYGE